jgi:hypothetical protein
VRMLISNSLFPCAFPKVALPELQMNVWVIFLVVNDSHDYVERVPRPRALVGGVPAHSRRSDRDDSARATPAGGGPVGQFSRRLYSAGFGVSASSSHEVQEAETVADILVNTGLAYLLSSAWRAFSTARTSSKTSICMLGRLNIEHEARELDQMQGCARPSKDLG